MPTHEGQHIIIMNEEEPTLRINENGTKYWRLKDGSRHRLNGPAIEYSCGNQGWYVNDVFIPTTELELSIGLPLSWDDEVAIVIKQINPILFQVLVGNKKYHLFSLFGITLSRRPLSFVDISYASP